MNAPAYARRTILLGIASLAGMAGLTVKPGASAQPDALLPPPGVPTLITIGETGVLPTFDNGNGGLLIAQKATLAQPATLKSLSFFVDQASGNIRLGLYDATGPNGGPGLKLAETAELTAVAGWVTGTVTPMALGAGTYWLAYLPSSDALSFRKGDGTAGSRYYLAGYGPLPAMFATTSSMSGSVWSLYATLAVSGPAAIAAITASAWDFGCPVCGSALRVGTEIDLVRRGP